MLQTSLEPSPRSLRDEDALRLARTHRGGLTQPFEQRHPNRLRQSDHVDDTALAGVEGREAIAHEVGDRWRIGHGAVPHPHIPPLHQRPATKADAHELAKEEEVAARLLGEVVTSARVDRRAQHGVEHFTDSGAVERRQVDPHREVVLPQRRDRVGTWLASANRHHHDETRARRDCGKRSSTVVELMRVVDGDEDGNVFAGRQLGESFLQDREAVATAARHRGRERRGEGAEGHRRQRVASRRRG